MTTQQLPEQSPVAARPETSTELVMILDDGMPNLTSIEEALKSKLPQPDYDVVPTVIEGISLRSEKGKFPEVVMGKLGQLAVWGASLADKEWSIKAQQRDQKISKDKIKELAEQTQGFRGLQSETDNYKVSVYPTYTLRDWHRGWLKRSLGPTYSTVVTENVDVNVSVPLGRSTPEGPLTAEMVEKALKVGMTALGFSQRDLRKLMKAEHNIKVDEPRLAEMVQSGQIKLRKGMVKIGKTWTLRVDPLVKSGAKKSSE